MKKLFFLNIIKNNDFDVIINLKLILRKKK